MNFKKSVLKEIDRMIVEWYPPPDTYFMKDIMFRYRSYCHWAIIEIRKCIIKSSPNLVIETLEKFRYKMDNLACSATDGNKNFMFSIAYDVTTDVLDVIQSIKRR